MRNLNFYPVKDMSRKKQSFAVQRARWLGVCVSSVLAMVGWALLLKGLPGALFFSFCATLLLLSTLLNPSLLKTPALLGYDLAVMGVGIAFNSVLCILFFVILTPVGLIARIFGKDFLSEKIVYKTANYWQKAPHSYWSANQKTKAKVMQW
jgi:hypothetical protein